MKKVLILGFISLVFLELTYPRLSSAQIRLIKFTGKVEVKKKTWPKFYPATPNDIILLNLEDQLKVDAKASATVKCSDFKTWDVPSGKIYRVSDGCSPGQATLKSPNSRREPPRNLENAIYVISPRNTNVLSQNPIFRWNNLPGATQYTVSIPEVNWKASTTETEIKYSGEEPLKRGWGYSIIVSANNGEYSKKQEFSILDEKTAKTVEEVANSIKQNQDSQEIEAILLSDLYRGYDLQAEASEVLEGLVKKGTQIVTVYQSLGEIYWQVGLTTLAKERYLKGLELARTNNNLEAKAALATGLGEISCSLDNKKEAKQWLDEAKKGYEALGDREQLQQVQERINCF